MASGKRKAVDGTPVESNAPVYNITQATINNYFAPAPAPVAKAPRTDEWAWLPEKPPRGGRLSQTVGGALFIKCAKDSCSRTRGPSKFIPVLNAKDTDEYTDAIDALATARETKDTNAFRTARDKIDQLKLARCLPCRMVEKKSQENKDTKPGACREEWARLRREEFHACGACGATRAVEANHRASYSDKMKEYNTIVKAAGVEAAEARIPKAERKIYSVSQYHFWKDNGGVEAMRAEADKCDPLCAMCHALDPSSSSANEHRADPDKVKREDYETQTKFADARNKAKYRKEKRDYNNTLKRAVGRCERGDDCPRDGPSGGVCSDGFEQCYQWDHVVEATKECGIADLCKDTHCLATAKPQIDAERAKCRLLCSNCHKTRSQWDTRAEAGSSSASV